MSRTLEDIKHDITVRVNNLESLQIDVAGLLNEDGPHQFGLNEALKKMIEAQFWMLNAMTKIVEQMTHDINSKKGKKEN